MRIPLWHIGLMVVMVMGAALLLTGYDAGLPLYESKDERHNLNEVYALRGLSNDVLWKPGYPPGILYVNYSAQLVTEAITGDSAWDRACEVIRTIRLEGVAVNLLTGLLIALVAYRLGGGAAAVIAPAVWFFSPRVLGQNQFAFPQVYEGFFYMLALYFALRAVMENRPWAAVFSVLAGLGAVVFKYTTFPVLALGCGAALWLIWQDRQRWWVLTVQVVLIVIVAVVMFTLGGASALIGAGHVEANRFVSGGLSGLLNLDLLHYIFASAAGQMGLGLVVLVVLAGVGTVLIWRYGTVGQRLGWLGALGLAFSHLVFLSTYIVYREGIDRNILSSSSVLAVVLAVALLFITRQVGAWFSRPREGSALLAVLVSAWLGQQLIASMVWVQYRDLPVTYGAMLIWADEVLPEEAMLVNDWRPFTREWSCYQRTERNAIQFEYLMDQPIEDWLAEDVYYAQLTQDEVDALAGTTEGQAYLAEMTLLKRFPPPAQAHEWRSWRRGFEMDISVFQLWEASPQVAHVVAFDETIQLLGYDLVAQTVRVGDTVTLTAYWQPLQPPPKDYSVFVHLTPVDDATTLVAQADGGPSRSNFRATTTWQDMDELFISRPFTLNVPAETPPGDYVLRLGLYDWQTGDRLLTAAGMDHIEIPLTVTP